MFYNGTDLGATNTGFSKETVISATADGEVFTFSDADGKGADMGSYKPTTDDMVGYGIGACFLDYLGANITNGDCTIEIPESVIVSSLSTLGYEASSTNEISVTANVSWAAMSNDSWITIDPDSGDGNATVSVTVTENSESSSRTGTVTFTGAGTDGDIIKTLTVTQEGVPATYGLILINDGSADDHVVVYSVFHEEVTGTKNNIAVNSLDKDFDTQWSGNNDADAADITPGTNVGEIIFDLGGDFDLELIDYSSTNGKRYEFQIWVSSTTTDDDAFTNVFLGQGNLVCETVDSEFTSFVFPETATGTKYVKIIGYGQPAKPSTWNTIVEVEFYGADIDTNGDDDGDGIMNDVDKCPNTPTGEVVDADGCSNGQLDDDNDGVSNADDDCADTPSAESVNANGCSESQLDDDNDGVSNAVDTCPDTPSGELVDANGCSESQLDDDNDGVMNDKDQCPNTPSGSQVNSLGCFTLSGDNFKIETVSETCQDEKNGKILISTDNTLNYEVTINDVLYNFTNSLKVDDLVSNTYDFCISVDGEDFEQCFNVFIEGGVVIAGKVSVKSTKVAVDISEGTAPFNVYLNEEKLFQTMSSSFEIDVLHGDLIQVNTAIICEGVFSKEINLLQNVTAYPNPTKGLFEVGLPIAENEVTIELYNMQSKLISSKTYSVNHGKVQMNIENLPVGIYLAKVRLENPVTFKIVKQ